MIDINSYRQKIGSFNNAGQRKFSMKTCSNKRKKNCEFIRRFLSLLIVFSTFSLLISLFNGGQSTQSNEHVQNQNYVDCKNEISCQQGRKQVRTMNNLYARCTYGNRINRGIKLSHWNAGSAHLPNKLGEIENVISHHQPHIFGISEANFLKKHNVLDVQIQDYEFITAQTLTNPKLQYSRVVVYKHVSIISKVRTDLMSKDFSSIWMECGLPNKKKFLVCNLYREWQYLGQGQDKSSYRNFVELTRLVIIISQPGWLI